MTFYKVKFRKMDSDEQSNHEPNLNLNPDEQSNNEQNLNLNQDEQLNLEPELNSNQDEQLNHEPENSNPDEQSNNEQILNLNQDEQLNHEPELNSNQDEQLKNEPENSNPDEQLNHEPENSNPDEQLKNEPEFNSNPDEQSNHEPENSNPDEQQIYESKLNFNPDEQNPISIEVYINEKPHKLKMDFSEKDFLNFSLRCVGERLAFSKRISISEELKPSNSKFDINDYIGYMANSIKFHHMKIKEIVPNTEYLLKLKIVIPTCSYDKSPTYDKLYLKLAYDSNAHKSTRFSCCLEKFMSENEDIIFNSFDSLDSTYKELTKEFEEIINETGIEDLIIDDIDDEEPDTNSFDLDNN